MQNKYALLITEEELEKSIRKITSDQFQKEINTRNIATKGYINARLFTHMDEMHNEKEKIKNDKNRAYLEWDRIETEALKKVFNDFIERTAKVHSRSNSSIKAKLFRMLQESYQKI